MAYYTFGLFSFAIANIHNVFIHIALKLKTLALLIKRDDTTFTEGHSFSNLRNEFYI